MDDRREAPKPKVPFYYSNEHDQGMGVPSRCRCGQSLSLLSGPLPTRNAYGSIVCGTMPASDAGNWRVRKTRRGEG
jgi:hypothetical protein